MVAAMALALRVHPYSKRQTATGWDVLGEGDEVLASYTFHDSAHTMFEYLRHERAYQKMLDAAPPFQQDRLAGTAQIGRREVEHGYR